MPYTMVTEDEL